MLGFDSQIIRLKERNIDLAVIYDIYSECVASVNT
jgi:hypothetical protein